MAISGTLNLPGDKSISHRALMLASLANGRSELRNLSTADDVVSTISCLKSCGLKYDRTSNGVIINGGNFVDPDQPLDCGNSGTTMRLLLGLLSGQGINATLIGDESLSKRPMKRIINPLKQMGLKIISKDYKSPIKIQKSKLNGISYHSPIASAQIKSSILFSGLGAAGTTMITEPILSRNHSEIMLNNLGAKIKTNDLSISITKSNNFSPLNLTIPSDTSTASFFIAAAILISDSRIKFNRLLLNPTRTGFLNAIKKMGCTIKFINTSIENGEKIGNVEVYHQKLKGITIDKNDVPSIIDELPILALMATQAHGITKVYGAEELRVKESDRIAAICDNLKNMGADVEELDGGFIIKGPTKLNGALIKTYDDHRIAMTFEIAALIAEGKTQLDNNSCISISFPEFYSTLESILQ